MSSPSLYAAEVIMRIPYEKLSEKLHERAKRLTIKRLIAT